MHGERLVNLVFSGVEGKISNKQFSAHFMSRCSRPTAFLGLFPNAGFQIITEPRSPEDFP
jgi:hypothetical protein